MIARALLLICVIGAALSAPVHAEHPDPGQSISNDKLPPLLQGVTFEQHMNGQTPRDLVFRDETGRQVKLGDYMGKKPVILTMNYFNCPQLCPLVLDALTASLQGVSFDIGKEFDVVTVSIDPRETPQIATKAKDRMLQRYARPGARQGWHFLTGQQASIRALADAVGFSYKYNPKLKTYIHPSGIMILTPQGKIARYFFGLEYPSKDVRLGLVEASANKIGTAIDHAMLFCYQYDPSTGRYGLMALKIMRLGGLLTAVALCGFIYLMRRGEPRHDRSLTEGRG